MSYAVTGVILMAVVTYIIRVLPITVFKKQIESRYIRSFLYYVPYAVIASLTFPGIFYATGNVMTAVLGTAAAIMLALFRQGLVVVAIGAILVVYISGLFL